MVFVSLSGYETTFVVELHKRWWSGINFTKNDARLAHSRCQNNKNSTLPTFLATPHKNISTKTNPPIITRTNNINGDIYLFTYVYTHKCMCVMCTEDMLAILTLYLASYFNKQNNAIRHCSKELNCSNNDTKFLTQVTKMRIVPSSTYKSSSEPV